MLSHVFKGAHATQPHCNQLHMGFSFVFKASAPVVTPPERLTGFSEVFKHNPYHDELGLFTTKDKATFISLWGKDMVLAQTPVENRREFKDIFDTPRSEESSMHEFEAMYEAHRKYLEKLTEEQLSAVRSYTSESYLDINGYFRGHDIPKDKVDEVKKISALIDKALDGIEVGVDCMCYRGVTGKYGESLRQKFENGTLIGTTLQDPGYVSASVSKGVAMDWSYDVNLHMRVRKEQKGLYVGMKPDEDFSEAQKYSKFPGEYEIIFPRKTPMTVTGAYEDGSGRLIVEVDVIPGDKNAA